MVLNYLHSYIAVVLIVLVRFNSADDNLELIRRLDALSNRVDLLEDREKILLNRIVELESNDKRQQQANEKLQHQLDECRHPLKQELPSTENEIPSHEHEVLQKKEIQDNTLGTNTGVAAKRIRQAAVDSPVAFTALLSDKFLHAGVKQIIIFDNAITNVGNHYNPIMGIFVAPVEGIYVFSATLVAENAVDSHSSFFHNNNQINIMYVNGGGWETTSSTIILHLHKGDMITVRNDDADDAYYGASHCSFSGFLLSNYESIQPIVGK